MLEDEVRAAIEDLRPAVQADGGDIFFRAMNAGTGVVQVELIGACASCPTSTVTLKAGLESILKDRVAGVTKVVNLGDLTLDGVPVDL